MTTSKETSFTYGQIVQPKISAREQLLVEKIIDSNFLKTLLDSQPIKQHDLNSLYSANINCLQEIALTNNDNGLLLSSFDIIRDNKETVKFFVVLFGTNICLIRESEIRAAIK